MNMLYKLFLAALLPAILQPAFAASSSFSSLSNFSYQLFDLDITDGTTASITFLGGSYSASATVYNGQITDAGNGYITAKATTSGSSALANITNTAISGGNLSGSFSTSASSSGADASYAYASLLGNFTLSSNTRVVFFADSSFSNNVTMESESAQSFAGLYAYSDSQYAFDEQTNDTLPNYDANNSIYSGYSNSGGRVLSVSFENTSVGQASGTLYVATAANVYSPVIAVPEPSSYALMIVGLSLFGFVASQRRKNNI